MAAVVLRVALALQLGLFSAVAVEGPVVITGATGRTGALLYNTLKAKGVSVRALVRNVTKAKEVLRCSACDASEGIFLGDVTKKETLVQAMEGAGALAIVASSVPVCTGGMDTCSYPKGAFPVDIDWLASKVQVEAFAESQKKAGKVPGPVVLCSSMGTTEPDSFLDKLGNGFAVFYKLNAEAALMSSGLPFTIVKPCGLSDTAAGEAQLLVGHDDSISLKTPITRGDVARVMAEATLQPEKAKGLRFDLCSQPGAATADFGKLFDEARNPLAQAQAQVVV